MIEAHCSEEWNNRFCRRIYDKALGSSCLCSKQVSLSLPNECSVSVVLCSYQTPLGVGVSNLEGDENTPLIYSPTFPSVNVLSFVERKSASSGTVFKS